MRHANVLDLAQTGSAAAVKPCTQDADIALDRVFFQGAAGCIAHRLHQYAAKLRHVAPARHPVPDGFDPVIRAPDRDIVTAKM